MICSWVRNSVIPLHILCLYLLAYATKSNIMFRVSVAQRRSKGCTFQLCLNTYISSCSLRLSLTYTLLTSYWNVHHDYMKCTYISMFNSYPSLKQCSKLVKELCVFYMEQFSVLQSFNLKGSTRGKLWSPDTVHCRPVQGCPLPLLSFHITPAVHFPEVLRAKLFKLAPHMNNLVNESLDCVID